MNIDGGPAIANVSLHTPLGTKIGFGVSITNDKKGLLDNSGLLLSVSYNLPVAETSFIRFGVSAGGAWNTVDFGKFDSGTDPALANYLDQNASITGNAGISFHHKTFHIGVAMPTLFSPSYVSENSFTITEVKPFQTLIFQASNRFYFNDNNNIFEPYAIYRMNDGLPSQYEVAGVIHLNHVIWLGGSYKQDFGISAVAGIKLQNMLAIGGAYSLQNTGINELNSPSFEVSISFLFGKHKKGTHAYSFVNTVKEKEKKPTRPTASEALAAKRKQEEEAKKKQEALAKAEADRKKAEEAKKQEALKKEPVITKQDPAKGDSAAGRHNPRFRQEVFETLKSGEELSKEQEQETLKRLEVHAENPTEQHGQEPTEHPNAERHEFVKRGGHQEELEVGDYVIGGAFKSDANAKHFAEGLVKLGFKADYGHLTEKNIWYVYLIQTNDINAARAERDRVRKLKLLKDAWLLTVQH